MVFDIKTGAQQAQQLFDAAQQKKLKSQIPETKPLPKEDPITKPAFKSTVAEEKPQNQMLPPVLQQPTTKKTKLNKADFMFKDKDGEILVKKSGDINGIDFMIKDLKNCTVVLMDHTAQIQVDRCENTKFYFGPIKSSLFIRNCDGCEITVACSQFRCRDLTNSKVFLYTPNDPIIESSTNLTFAPYNFMYPQL